MAASHSSGGLAVVSWGDTFHRRRDEARPRSRPWLVHASRSEFANFLEAEMRRAERSSATLSLAFLHHADRAALAAGAVAFWPAAEAPPVVVVQADEKGVALLLPGTTKAGAVKALEELVRAWPADDTTFVVYTYPDDVVDSVFRGIDATHLPFLAAGASWYRRRAWLKRLLDVTGALTAATLLAPVMLIVALAVAVGSRGPIIFRQVRLGRGGRRFTLYKFRSMRHDADARLHQEHVSRLLTSTNDRDEAAGSGSWTQIADDPRVTPVGKVLRRLKLDELPQLLNVLKGDLSLVGPRPALLYEVALYRPWHLRRLLHVKPGVTGLWQVDGGDHTTFDDMVRMDLQYVERWSNRLDLSIIMRTAGLIVHRTFEYLRRKDR